MKNAFLAPAGLLLISTLLMSSPASAGDWERLGSRKVNFVGDKDTIAVTAAEGRFDTINLEVDKGDLEMYDVVVTFGDGSKFSPETRFNFDQGTNSRTIDLPGNARIIKKVEFHYRSKVRKGHAQLSLWGRHARPDVAPPSEVRPPAPGGRWDALGFRQVSFATEKDTIVVTASEGVFDALRFDVDNGDLEMFNVVVTFGDGSRFSPETRYNFDQGTRSRVIDLPGGARVIRTVDFLYRSTVRKGHATLSLFGRHVGVVTPDAPPRPAPIAAPPVVAPRWEVLGTRQVKFRGEKDTIPVTRKEGLFDAIMVEVDNGDLEMFSVACPLRTVLR